ncbi:hypothetical protein L1987_52845 [Smallanthus sonchifolius]|uniref:Uncharacterized protein n=1 Tax=Smallanthus sonchifolius TaxID=185202 RepID=A0ACB9EUJ8_9ASTR|nr:hypothetical protein L1987_52845 [Smallanthus sonchifolius]
MQESEETRRKRGRNSGPGVSLRHQRKLTPSSKGTITKSTGNIFGAQPRNDNENDGWEDDDGEYFGYKDNEDVRNGDGFGDY